MAAERREHDYQVAIVGGGVTGLYCAWKLAGKRIGFFEASDRLGGRIETVLMPQEAGPKFKAEFGPMRYEKPGQEKLMTLLEDLGLVTTPFPAYGSEPPKWPAYLLREEEQRWPKPLDLLLMGILSALGLYKRGMDKPAMEDVVRTFNEGRYPKLRRTARLRGQPQGPFLYQMGLWNALSEVFSHQAVLKIRDTGTFYHVIHENSNAIEWIIFWLRALQPDDRLVGIKGGSSKLRDKLVEKLTVEPECRHRLVSLRDEGGRVHLRFEHPGGEVSAVADHVILALPKKPLERLATSLPDLNVADLDAVRGIPLLKCFFVVDKPWWTEDTRPQTRADLMPVREVHYYLEHSLQLAETHRADLERLQVTSALRVAFQQAGIVLPQRAQLLWKQHRTQGWLLTDYGSTFYSIASEDLSVYNRHGKGMVMAYTDRPATEYWNQFVVDRTRHDRAEMRKSQTLKERFFKYLAKQIPTDLAGAEEEPPERLQHLAAMGGEEEIERALLESVLDWGIHDWEHEPYGGAFHIWRPHAKSWEVIERLKAFGPGKRYHIAGEAFSDYQGFIEGCLNSADLALGTIP